MYANKKGVTVFFLIVIIISIAAAGLLIYRTYQVTLGENNVIDKAEDVIDKGILGEIKEITGEKENIPCTEEENIENNMRLIREEARKMTNPEIDEKFALAIADVESDFMHCRDGTVVESNTGSLGIMQVTRSTARGSCPSEIDITQLLGNIQCAMLIIQVKYRAISDFDVYEAAVTRLCEDEDIEEKYLTYTDVWDRTARAYNSLDCEPPADPNYVETFRVALANY